MHKEKLKTSCLKGVEAARKANLGRKRPEHSEFMKALNAKNAKLYPTPKGNLRLINEFYKKDFLRTWCNNPDVLITPAMIGKPKNTSQEWIGKTRREVGFSEPFCA